MTLEKRLCSAMRGAVERGAAPGLVYLVAEGDCVLAWEALGAARLGTLYDLASLTKPLCTAALALQFMNAGELRPSDRVEKFLPAFKGHWIGGARVSRLLTHTAGFPAWHPLYREGRGRANYLRVLQSLAPAHRPGARVEYCCPGYIVLGFILEKIGGAKLDALFRERIAAPLGLARTRFRPPASWRKDIAPTERGSVLEKTLTEKKLGLRSRLPWERGLLRGLPHDGNARHLGGVAGNSGLFSSAWELFMAASSLLDPEDGRMVPVRLKRLMLRDQTGRLHGGRTFGWKRAPSSPPVARALAADAVGHGGFTGTSLWLEPSRKRIYVLLSNRVHPRVRPEGFDGVRREFHRLAARL
jgi:CubicO group peptidase (beta-lactamase class C family)